MQSELKIFLCHPGGPFYKNKDEGVWTIPKGEFEDDEEPLTAAKREFKEETGHDVEGKFIELKPVKYKDGRKMVYAWAVQSDIDAASIFSNTFQLQWPPKSGRFIQVPEIDRGDWFSVDGAKQKISPSLLPVIEDFLARS